MPDPGVYVRIYKARRLEKDKPKIMISYMHNDKAPGTDGVTAEVFKLEGAFIAGPSTIVWGSCEVQYVARTMERSSASTHLKGKCTK